MLLTLFHVIYVYRKNFINIEKLLFFSKKSIKKTTKHKHERISFMFTFSRKKECIVTKITISSIFILLSVHTSGCIYSVKLQTNTFSVMNICNQ